MNLAFILMRSICCRCTSLTNERWNSVVYPVFNEKDPKLGRGNTDFEKRVDFAPGEEFDFRTRVSTSKVLMLYL